MPAKRRSGPPVPRAETQRGHRRGVTENEHGLNARQEAFCNEWLIDKNATQAAIRAGYSLRTASSQGYDLLRNPEINKRICQLQDALLASRKITPAVILDEYRKLATFDVRRLYHPDGTPKPLTDLDDDTAAAIVGIDAVTIGNAESGLGQVLKYKLASKQAALDSLSKHFGLFVDRTEISGPGGGPVEVSLNADEMARRLAYTLSRVPSPDAPPAALEAPESGGELP